MSNDVLEGASGNFGDNARGVGAVLGSGYASGRARLVISYVHILAPDSELMVHPAAGIRGTKGTQLTCSQVLPLSPERSRRCWHI